MSAPLLDISDLSVDYAGRHGGPAVRALDHASLRLERGQTLGLVGGSGSGKSTIGKAVLGLVRPAAGRILFDGQDITHAAAGRRRALGQHIQAVFQDPFGSLNPSRAVGGVLAEPLRLVQKLPKAEAAGRVRDALALVGLEPDAALRRPAAFSGGQRQRIAIARAIVVEPDLVVCDEPTSALDLSIQAQILNLLLELQQRRGLSYLFISHDVDVVRHMAHHMAVLHRGRVVESGASELVTHHPQHPFTRRLIDGASRK